MGLPCGKFARLPLISNPSRKYFSSSLFSSAFLRLFPTLRLVTRHHRKARTDHPATCLFGGTSTTGVSLAQKTDCKSSIRVSRLLELLCMRDRKQMGIGTSNSTSILNAVFF